MPVTKTAAASPSECTLSMGGWRVVLLVDSRERSHSTTKFLPNAELVKDIDQHFRRYTNANEKHCETRNLLAGDYAWVAQRKSEEGVVEERLLDCIIERKSFGDMCGTLTKKARKHAPLSRMEIQMKKLKATTLENKILLLEGFGGESRGFRSKQVHHAGMQFLKDLREGTKYPGIKLHQSKNIIGSVQFLIDRHQDMMDVLRNAYQEAQLDPTNDDPPHETIMTQPPFAVIGTVDKMREAIQSALDDPTFHYYLKLRRVDMMGNKCNEIMKVYPSEAALSGFLGSLEPTQAVKALAKLPSIGKVLATRVQEAFASPVETKKEAPSVVTPPAKPTKAKKRPCSSTKAAVDGASAKQGEHSEEISPTKSAKCEGTKAGASSPDLVTTPTKRAKARKRHSSLQKAATPRGHSAQFTPTKQTQLNSVKDLKSSPNSIVKPLKSKVPPAAALPESYTIIGQTIFKLLDSDSDSDTLPAPISVIEHERRVQGDAKAANITKKGPLRDEGHASPGLQASNENVRCVSEAPPIHVLSESKKGKGKNTNPQHPPMYVELLDSSDEDRPLEPPQKKQKQDGVRMKPRALKFGNNTTERGKV